MFSVRVLVILFVQRTPSSLINLSSLLRDILIAMLFHPYSWGIEPFYESKQWATFVMTIQRPQGNKGSPVQHVKSQQERMLRELSLCFKSALRFFVALLSHVSYDRS